MTKPIPLSRLKRKRQYKELDTVASSKSDTRKGMDMIFEAQTYYNCMDYARRQAHRCKNYQLGRQWSDRVYVDGAWMTEEDYIKQQGSVPLQQNLMRRLTRNVLGQFRQYAKEPTCSCADHDEAIYGEAMNVLLVIGSCLTIIGGFFLALGIAYSINNQKFDAEMFVPFVLLVSVGVSLLLGYFKAKKMLKSELEDKE